MEIYLIRHTTPVLTPGLIYGRKDLRLHADFSTEREAVRASLAAYSKSGMDAVYSSPAFRCTELAKALSPHILIDPRLQELDFGKWEGMTWDTVDQPALQAWMNDYVNVCTPGGESMLQMHARVQEFWNELSQSGFRKIGIVTHAGVIRLILSIVRDIALQEVFAIKIRYGEVIRLEQP